MKVEEAVLQHIQEHGVKTPWLVPTGVAAQLHSVATLLEKEMFGDSERLTKTLRACRDAVLGIYNAVSRREFACMMECRCMGGPYTRWPLFTAGCAICQGSAYSLGGRLWDLVEFLRQHHGYENPKLVATVAVGALKALAYEFQLKENSLLRAVTKMVPATGEQKKIFEQ